MKPFHCPCNISGASTVSKTVLNVRIGQALRISKVHQTACLLAFDVGATRRDRTGDLLITKYDQRLQRLHQLHTDVPVINNMGKLLSLKEQLRG